VAFLLIGGIGYVASGAGRSKSPLATPSFTTTTTTSSPATGTATSPNSPFGSAPSSGGNGGKTTGSDKNTGTSRAAIGDPPLGTDSVDNVIPHNIVQSEPGRIAITTDGVGQPRFVAGLVVLPTNASLRAYDPRTGNLAWQSSACIGGDWAGPIPPASHDIAILACGSQFVAFAGRDGTELWRHAIVPEADHVRLGSRYLVLNTDAKVEVIDAHTGADVWSRANPGEASVASDEQFVYIGNDDQLDAVDPATGQVAWSVPGNISDVSRTDDALYMKTTKQMVSRINPKTGAIRWTTMPEQFRLGWSLALGQTDNSLLMMANHTDVYFTAYDTDNGGKLWERDLKPGHNGFGAVTGQAVVLLDYTERSGGVATIHAAYTGEERRVLSTSPASYPAAADGYVALIEYAARSYRLLIQTVA